MTYSHMILILDRNFKLGLSKSFLLRLVSLIIFLYFLASRITLQYLRSVSGLNFVVIGLSNSSFPTSSQKALELLSLSIPYWVLLRHTSSIIKINSLFGILKLFALFAELFSWGVGAVVGRGAWGAYLFIISLMSTIVPKKLLFLLFLSAFSASLLFPSSCGLFSSNSILFSGFWIFS